MSVKHVTLYRQGKKFYGKINGGKKFYIGTRVSYLHNFGLMNTAANSHRYVPGDYEDKYGFWAYFIAPTAQCETKGRFHCTNTYDRAGFTFGFMQYAAHVPNGDFVRFFRKLLETPEGAEYFPDLEVVKGRICKESYRGYKILEDAESTEGLQKYLNPSLDEVEDMEAINAAKLVDWATSSRKHRALQVDCGIEHTREKMAVYSRRYSLDGMPDKVCLVIADIRHQGRARSSEIIEAVNTAGDPEAAYRNLLKLGEHCYASRIATLKAAIKELENDGYLGGKVYVQAEEDFLDRDSGLMMGFRANRVKKSGDKHGPGPLHV